MVAGGLSVSTKHSWAFSKVNGQMFLAKSPNLLESSLSWCTCAIRNNCSYGNTFGRLIQGHTNPYRNGCKGKSKQRPPRSLSLLLLINMVCCFFKHKSLKSWQLYVPFFLSNYAQHILTEWRNECAHLKGEAIPSATDQKLK